MAENVILAIDCGTQSLRALLFTATGELVDRVQEKYSPYVSENPGWAEQDPEVFWDSLCRACKALKDRQPDAFARIAGVGVTTQRNSMINVDAQGAPLRPTVTWLDQRLAEPSLTDEQLRAMGLDSPELAGVVRGFQAQGKCNWIRQNQPDIWGATHKYLQVSGFLNHRLTGRFADSVASQIGHLPFDYAKGQWAGGDNLFGVLFAVEPEKLPELVAPGEVLGSVTAQAAAATGIPQGVAVVACGSDKGCETLGAGAIDETMANFSFGTTATIQTTTPRYFEPLPFMPPYPAVVPGCYNPEVMIPRGFLLVSWFKDQFGAEQVAQAKAKGVVAEQLMDDFLVQTPPGAQGLMVSPHWGGALDDPFARGSMVGFADVHTKAHVYRGIIEGLGFALRDGFEKLQAAGGLRIRRVTVSGGASQSDAICGTVANILDVALVKGRTHEASGLGAAIITALGVGVFSTLGQASESMVQSGTVYAPDPHISGLYRELYTRVYREMNSKPLGELCSELRSLTG